MTPTTLTICYNIHGKFMSSKNCYSSIHVTYAASIICSGVPRAISQVVGCLHVDSIFLGKLYFVIVNFPTINVPTHKCTDQTFLSIFFFSVLPWFSNEFLEFGDASQHHPLGTPLITCTSYNTYRTVCVLKLASWLFRVGETVREVARIFA